MQDRRAPGSRPLVRPAVPADAWRLAELRSAPSEEDLVQHEIDFLDRLAIPHGEDYFCFVASVEDRLVGYVTGGGSRELDRKAHGEIYELGLAENDVSAEEVGRALLDRAITELERAAFAGTLLRVASGDATRAEIAEMCGMVPDGTESGGRSVRYERKFSSR